MLREKQEPDDLFGVVLTGSRGAGIVIQLA